MKNTQFKLTVVCAAFALAACGGTDPEPECTAGAKQCVGEQIQTCGDDGAWGVAEDCAAGQACSEGHDGMDYVHCMDEMGHDDEGHDDEGHGDEGLEAEACEHMAEDAGTTVTAGADEANATDMSHSDWEEKRVDITLNAVDGGFAGYVTYEVEADGDIIFFTSTEAMLMVAGAMAESSEMIDACADIDHSYIFELTVGEHVLHITSPSETVSLVVEPAGAHSIH